LTYFQAIRFQGHWKWWWLCLFHKRV